MDESRGVPGLLAAVDGARLARVEAGPGSQSHRVDNPRDRRLGAAIPAHRASGYAGQQYIEHAAVHAVSTDARKAAETAAAIPLPGRREQTGYAMAWCTWLRESCSDRRALGSDQRSSSFAGRPGFMATVKEILKSLGVRDEHILQECFTIAARASNLQPLRGARWILLNRGGSTRAPPPRHCSRLQKSTASQSPTDAVWGSAVPVRRACLTGK